MSEAKACATVHTWEGAVRIGELAARAGVSVRSLRYYEEQGLLGSTRSASGQRRYTPEEVERVRFIQRLYAAGLSSHTIAELLPCVDSPSEENSDRALERMAQERDRLSEHIADLVRTRDSLDELIASRIGRTGRACGPRRTDVENVRWEVRGGRRTGDRGGHDRKPAAAWKSSHGPASYSVSTSARLAYRVRCVRSLWTRARWTPTRTPSAMTPAPVTRRAMTMRGG